MAARKSPGVRKSIYDPVHGTVSLERAALDLIGTAAFQRLWGIRQTGLAHLVFPGANHTRLEHSLGVFWVAQRFAHALGFDLAESEPVGIGGLLHDLGHPPFSHTLDPSLHESFGVGHESISREWILGKRTMPGETTSVAEILERHSIAPNLVADLVDPRPGRARGFAALLHSAVDADRLDYLQRDAHYTGVAHGVIDAGRIIETARWYARRLCFAEKGRSALEGFLLGRALMYSSVYYHKTVRAAEVMVQSGLERLPGYPEATRDLLGQNDGQFLNSLSHASERGRAIVDGILTRQLFKRVGGLTEIGASTRERLVRWDARPRERRASEDDIADRLRIPAGELLLDLSGLSSDREAEREWNNVALLEEGRLTFPFRGDAPWTALLRRPPSRNRVSVYVHPRHRRASAARVARAVNALLG